MKLTYFIYLQITTCRLIKHFTVIYADANKQFLTLNLIFFAAKKSPYLGPQSPYQKLQISLFEPKKISHVCWLISLQSILVYVQHCGDIFMVKALLKPRQENVKLPRQKPHGPMAQRGQYRMLRSALRTGTSFTQLKNGI